MTVGDSIPPQESRERFVQAVRTKRVNPTAQRIVDMTIEQLITDDGQSPVLYVPAAHVDRIVRLYGGFTMLDFDEVFKMNIKIGQPYDNCFNSMVYYMNVTGGDMRDQWEKVSHEKSLADVFNLVQSTVRSRVGECVWYE